MKTDLIAFNENGFTINGKRQFFSSTDFHYFRVPKSDWERRLKLFIAAGGNCVATYVPWVIHEPTEGDIRFGDCDARDLVGFLKVCAKLNLPVMIRPGPYQYAELICSGIPRWLCDNYPEVMARNSQDKIFCDESFSYIHPLFLEKAERYLTAVIEVVRPYLAQNGGPVAMIQLDNELIGAHIWHGSIDYNRESMGIGTTNGRYPEYLKRKYVVHR